MLRSAVKTYADGAVWWDTAISQVKKNEIIIRGYPIEELIGTLSYSQMLYLLLCGEVLSPKKARLLESVLIAGADHGPRAPSIAAARMAATCGISFNSCVATGINLLGDVHGGAAERAMKLFYRTNERLEKEPALSLAEVIADELDELEQRGEKLAGMGHQLHDDDPRIKKLYALAEELVQEGEISGKYLHMAEAYRSQLEQRKQKKITMNVDGAAAAIQCELDIPAEAAKGIFALSRGLGIVAHALEELQNKVLIKGPCPNREDLVGYSGPARRHLQPQDHHF